MGQQQSASVRSTGKGLAARSVHHAIDGSPVLGDVSLSVDPGEVLAVIGPSGTGKTTLLRLLALFDRPDDGTIRIQSEDVWAVSERERLAARRRIGMVFQEANLFDGTVRRNVSYGFRVRRPWSQRIRRWWSRPARDGLAEHVADSLDLVGLDDAADRSARSLSGGEAQRVAFARALAYDPEFLLLDEPTSDLDPRNTAVIEEAIAAARNRGLGVVVATHDMHQAERVADRVAVLLDGSVIEMGPAEQVFDDPTDERARKFIDGELVY